MSSEMDKQVKRMDARFNNAVVDEISDGVYEVFVPGAPREVTTVNAESEDEAKEKVRTLLLNKVEHTIGKKNSGKSDGEIKPDSSSHVSSATEPGGEA